jgi:hypothetical protein
VVIASSLHLHTCQLPDKCMATINFRSEWNVRKWIQILPTKSDICTRCSTIDRLRYTELHANASHNARGRSAPRRRDWTFAHQIFVERKYSYDHIIRIDSIECTIVVTSKLLVWSAISMKTATREAFRTLHQHCAANSSHQCQQSKETCVHFQDLR